MREIGVLSQELFIAVLLFWPLSPNHDDASSYMLVNFFCTLFPFVCSIKCTAGEAAMAVQFMLQTNGKSLQKNLTIIFKLYASFQKRRPGVKWFN